MRQTPAGLETGRPTTAQFEARLTSEQVEVTRGDERIEGGGLSAELLSRARTGDDDAFKALTAPHLRELHVHCYRILGSVQDAEDALQDSLLSAWHGLRNYEGRASLRTWLYRIATNRCLDLVRSAKRRPVTERPASDFNPPEPTRLGEITWLEPYPDVLLEDVGAGITGPDARYDAIESMSLAFVTALQHLPPRQRAVLVLRDVLDFEAREVADILATSVDSVTSALKRARATLRSRAALSGANEPPPPPRSPEEEELAGRLARAYEAGDVNGVIALLTDGVWISMPPLPLEYQGLDLASRFLSSVAFRAGQRWQLVPTRANGQPAFGAYIRARTDGVSHALGLLVLTLAGDKISAITMFDKSVLPFFGLPRSLRE
jgi:RNA polymerase sigma-70 factor (TIGR02960 family)